MDDNEVDNSEIICVEVQENENGEIIYMEKIENDYVVMDDDFCVVECEIATSGETSSNSENNNSSDQNSEGGPVEVIFLPNFDEDGNENPIILKQEIDECDNLSDENSHTSETLSSVKSVRTYVKKHSNLVKIGPISEHKYMKLQTPIKNCTATKTEQTQKLNALLQVASGKVNQLSESQMPNLQEEKTEKEHIANAIAPVRRLNAFSQQRPKLWSHRVDRKNFDKTNFLNNITNITSLDTVSQEKQLHFKQDGTSFPKYEVNSVEVRTGVKRKVKDLPYQCEACDKSFRQSSSLVIHLKVHAGKYADNCVLS